MLALDGLRAAGQWYAGDLPLQHPWCSPVHCSLHPLPPLHIWRAGLDVCAPAAMQLAHRARQQGAPIVLHYAPHMPHAWPLLPTSEGQAAQRILAQEMQV